MGKLTPLPLLALLATLWGSSYWLIDVVVDALPAATATLGRLLFALLFLAALMRGGGEAFPTEPRSWRLYLGIALCGFTAPFFLLSWGQMHIASGLAAILISAVPIFTFLLTGLVTRREPLTLRRAVGIAIGFLGVVVLFGPEQLLELATVFWAKLAIVGAALGFALANMLSMSLRPGLSPVVSSTAVLLLATLAMVPFALAIDQPWRLTFAWREILMMGALGAACTGLASVVFFRILATAGATFASLANYLVPVVGVVLGVILLGERIRAEMLAALALVLTGVALATARGADRPGSGAPRDALTPPAARAARATRASSDRDPDSRPS